MNQGILYALSAAVLFGASIPFAKMLTGQLTPLMLAGLLYLGNGLGLTTWFLLRKIRKTQENNGSHLKTKDIPWLLGAIMSGGIAGPVLLMIGLTITPASAASLLLNMEGVLTALLAWFVFKENFDRRILAGMLLIVIAGVLLPWQQRLELGVTLGTLAIIGACLCWAIDNNLTRKISASDAVQIAGIKGMAAATVNLTFAWLQGAAFPATGQIATAGTIGLCGYGFSLVLFVLALRHLGSARTGAYFSAAPFAGAALSLLLLHDAPGPLFWIAALLMFIGIWLHISECHNHFHQHEALAHTHPHTHDVHHQHPHDFAWDGKEPHSHSHQHVPLAHTHEHFPDIHHQHKH